MMTNKTLAAVSLSTVLAACVSTGPIVQDPPVPQKQDAAPAAGRAAVAQAPVAKRPVIVWEKGDDRAKDPVGVQQCRGTLTGGGKLDALKKFTGAASVDGGCVAIQTYDPAAKRPAVLVVGQITGVNCNTAGASAAATAAHVGAGFLNKLPSPGVGAIGGTVGNNVRRAADTAGAAQVADAQKVCNADLAIIYKSIDAKVRELSSEYSAANRGVVPKALCSSNLGKKDEAAIIPSVCVPPTPAPARQ